MKLRQALLVSAKVHRILEYGLRQLMAGKVDFATARCEAGLAVRELGFPDLFDWIDDVLSLNAALLSDGATTPAAYTEPSWITGLHRNCIASSPAQLIGNGTGSIAKTLPTVNHLKVDGSKLAASSTMAG